MHAGPGRVKEVFLEAAEQPQGPARAAFLDRACGGDAELRARVEALLRAHDAGDSFLAQPAAVLPGLAAPGPASPEATQGPAPVGRPPHAVGRTAAAVLLLLAAGFGALEVAGVTRVGLWIGRLFSPDATRAAEEPTTPADAAAWERFVAGLPAEQRVKAVAARIEELNPGFDGALVPTIEGGEVRGLELNADGLKDITPLRALTALSSLAAQGTAGRRAPLSDLSPLRGLPLTELSCSDTLVRDLSPLEGMRLRVLRCANTNVSDLSPLRAMPLERLELSWTKTSSLGPLAGMKLRHLGAEATRVGDLSPLKGAKLTLLNVSNTVVADLSPLRDMELALLHAARTPVSDLSPLREMPLQVLNCDGTQVDDRALRHLEGCKRLTHVLVQDTRATAAGIDRLKKALPHCKVR